MIADGGQLKPNKTTFYTLGLQSLCIAIRMFERCWSIDYCILTHIHRPSLETNIFNLNNWSVVPNLGSSHVIKLSFFHINYLKPESLANRRLENRKKNSPIINHDKGHCHEESAHDISTGSAFIFAF